MSAEYVRNYYGVDYNTSHAHPTWEITREDRADA